jgi:hypothetical protein
VDRTSRTRRSVAVLCLALVVVAALAPGGASTFVYAFLVPLWLIVPAVVAIVIQRTASDCDEQPASLLSIVLSRAPPAPAVPA